ncbi:hypothetical protein PIB30_007880 [Stylosanthes scabra]|uniref:Uncharacterized protein n=1 Tax=Stylosanthes scabra TaxID=79078 RepID=A0ABU6R3L0_9FABA|nr:hypothetical protein [Stylosanthes scabra]
MDLFCPGWTRYGHISSVNSQLITLHHTHVRRFNGGAKIATNVYEEAVAVAVGDEEEDESPEATTMVNLPSLHCNCGGKTNTQ